MPGIQQPTKTPISESKIAVFWRTALYLFSAGMMGKAAAGFSDGYVAEAVGDLGLSLVFIGMCFRSTELAILAYISDPAKRNSSIRQDVWTNSAAATATVQRSKAKSKKATKDKRAAFHDDETRLFCRREISLLFLVLLLFIVLFMLLVEEFQQSMLLTKDFCILIYMVHLFENVYRQHNDSCSHSRMDYMREQTLQHATIFHNVSFLVN